MHCKYVYHQWLTRYLFLQDCLGMSTSACTFLIHNWPTLCRCLLLSPYDHLLENPFSTNFFSYIGNSDDYCALVHACSFFSLEPCLIILQLPSTTYLQTYVHGQHHFLSDANQPMKWPIRTGVSPLPLWAYADSVLSPSLIYTPVLACSRSVAIV